MVSEKNGRGDLRDVDLEHSRVLGLDEGPGVVTFRVDFVLRETHPTYGAPVPGEPYCSRRGQLNFPNPKSVHWNEPAFESMADPTDEVDYGNIDALIETGPGTYLVEGEWGSVLITSDEPEVVLESR